MQRTAVNWFELATRASAESIAIGEWIRAHNPTITVERRASYEQGYEAGWHAALRAVQHEVLQKKRTL